MFECHITIEPVFDQKLEQAKVHGAQYGFKVASLLMKKRENSTEERSEHDTFMTGHSSNLDDMQSRMINCVNQLKTFGYKVWRYKIEHILIDSKYQNDTLELLS